MSISLISSQQKYVTIFNDVLITSKGLALIGHDINDDSIMNSAVQFMYNNNNNIFHEFTCNNLKI